LAHRAQKYPTDKTLAQNKEDVSQEIYKTMTFVRDFHITSLFIGKDKKKKDTEYYTSFKPGHKMEIQLVGLVIVPNKIVTAICYPDQSQIKIENRFPHMTLMTGEWKPVDSNELLENLFGQSKPYHEDYLTRKFANRSNLTWKQNIETSKGKELAYFVKTSDLKLPAIAAESF
ncbi:MAG TPA: hypothetical protein PLS50_09595, partial [Candidatus Dojkabacteria bacterium]|nr:hypothetical protein [Candidatus Dojkabacteria bacterium]